MPVHERRQHFRVEDHIYFDYKIIEMGGICSDKTITEDLLGQNGQRYLETTQYFQSVDYELTSLTRNLALQDAALAHYLNLLNSKIDYLARHLFIGDKVHLRKVNISLGGMSFNAKERIKEKTHLKIVIYTKPRMIPILIDGVSIYSQFMNGSSYRTAIQFDPLTAEQEQLLSQHIMQAQTKCRAD